MRCPSVTTMTRMSFSGQLPRILRDAPPVVRRDEKALRLPGDVRELSAGFANGGRVDPRQGFFEVGDHRPVEQVLVTLLHRGERHVPVDVARQHPEALHRPIDELSLGGDRVRQQALQSQAQTLLAREGNGLVERLVAQDVEGSLRRHVRTCFC